MKAKLTATPNDADLTFNASSTVGSNVVAPSQYAVTWSYNGLTSPTLLPAQIIPQSAASDASGYSTSFVAYLASINSTIVLSDGDKVGCSITAENPGANATPSTPVTLTTVTIPTPPAPTVNPPQNAVLVAV